MGVAAIKMGAVDQPLRTAEKDGRFDPCFRAAVMPRLLAMVGLSAYSDIQSTSIWALW